MNFPIFRFDDVSVNTDLEKLSALIDVIKQHQPTGTVLLAISPIVFGGVGERVHPTQLTAMSSLSPYYAGTRCGLPVIPWRDGVVLAGHGIAHVDHRLLGRKAQELSIVMSCALAGAKVFCPPYNHYDSNTRSICYEHGIELIVFEVGWLHALYNPFRPDHERFYMHPFDMTPQQLKEWFAK